MAIGILLHLTIAPMGDAFAPFLVGGALVIVGLGIFLHGTELGMVPIGQKAGAAITSKRNVALLLFSAFPSKDFRYENKNKKTCPNTDGFWKNNGAEGI